MCPKRKKTFKTVHQWDVLMCLKLKGYVVVMLTFSIYKKLQQKMSVSVESRHTRM